MFIPSLLDLLPWYIVILILFLVLWCGGITFNLCCWVNVHELLVVGSLCRCMALLETLETHWVRPSLDS